MTGTDGRDLLIGAGGADVLDGLAGDDQLNGGAGDDRLIGGTGDDTLYGNRGADTFVFTAGFGADRIGDFDARRDMIDLRALSLDPDQGYQITDAGPDALVTVADHGTITLPGTAIDQALEAAILV